MILACGEALIDMLPRHTDAGEPAFAPHAGGAVFNTAIALGRLKAPARFFSGLSTDLFGDQLRAALEDSGVDSTPAALSDRPTTLAFVTLEGGHAKYAFYDENTAGRLLTEADLPAEIPDDVLFFGGISLAVDPCGAAYQALMLREAPAKVTMLDPNIRPGFIRDEPRYRARLKAMLAAADIVKVSDEDMAWLGHDPGTLRAMGPRLVCVTEGAKGVTAHTARGEIFVPAEKAEVVDTVGAGDTFNAGLLASLHAAGALTKARVAALTEEEIRAALAYGAKAAAVTVTRAGANPPRADEL